MSGSKHVEQANIGRLKELVEELTVRDEQIFREHGVFEQIVRLVLDGIWIINEKFDTIFVNDKMSAMLGYTHAQMAGEELFKFITEKNDQEIAKKIISKKKYGISEKHIFKLQRANGTFTFAALTTSPLFGQNRSYRGSIIYVREITNDEILNYYKQIFFDVSLDALLITNLDGIIQDINHQYCDTVGYDREEIIGKHYLNFVYTDDKNRSDEAFNELVNGNDLLEFENSLISKNGSPVRIAWRAKTVLENRLIFASGRRLLQ